MEDDGLSSWHWQLCINLNPRSRKIHHINTDVFKRNLMMIELIGFVANILKVLQ